MAAPIRRIALLTADVGEGHLAAARALAEGLEELAPDADVVVVDALDALGPVLRVLLRDAYRFQLRRASWVFHSFFWFFHHVRPLRALGRFFLALLGARRLDRALRALAPDLVVSTYPAATSVLGCLRRRGRITVPTVATITDFAGIAFWAHRGIDLHLVMHPSLVPLVEREAGRGSARAVAPLVGNAFRDAAGNRDDARSNLGLAQDDRVVVVSGGGWGVGDLEGAAALAAALPDTTVVVLAGRNDALASALAARYAENARVRVLGFTDAVPQLLAAADAVVHTTGGVTCLEALTVGCPIIAYGPPRGHAPSLARAMAKLGIAEYPRTAAELTAALLAPRPRRADGAGRTASEELLVARPRDTGRARARVGSRALTAGATALVTLLLLGSRTAFGVIGTSFAIAPATNLPTHHNEVALVIDAPPVATATIARLLADRHATASFAFRRAPARPIRALLSKDGDEAIITLGASGLDDWIGTGDAIRDARLGRIALSPSGGINVGQYLLARMVGAHLIAPSARLRRGAVVLWKGGSLTRLLDAIRANDLRPVSIETLEQ